MEADPLDLGDAVPKRRLEAVWQRAFVALACRHRPASLAVVVCARLRRGCSAAEALVLPCCRAAARPLTSCGSAPEGLQCRAPRLHGCCVWDIRASMGGLVVPWVAVAGVAPINSCALGGRRWHGAKRPRSWRSV